MPENGIDVADPGRGNRPSLGTGLCGTALSFICGGVVLFHSIKCAEHPNWLILAILRRRVAPDGSESNPTRAECPSCVLK